MIRCPVDSMSSLWAFFPKFGSRTCITWTDPISRRRSNELHLKATNPCSSTPIPLGQAPSTESRQPESINPAQANPVELPSNRMNLFDRRYTEGVTHHHRFVWNHDGDDDIGPDEDLEGEPIENLDSAAHRNIANLL